MIDASNRTREARVISQAGPTRTVRDSLASYRGARVIYPPHVDDAGRYLGNNGDLLIMAGIERLFHDLEFKIATSEEKADLIVMCGGGGLRERGRWVLGILRDCCQRLRHLPLVVLPSSFEFPSQPLAAEIGDREAPVVLFCREAYSYLHLLRDHDLPQLCSVELDHDMAFELESGSLVERLRGVEGDQVLLVERTDSETPAAESRASPARKRRFLRRLVPSTLKPLLWRLRALIQARQRTPFRARCEALIQTQYADLATQPRRVLDVSSPRAGDFDFFCSEIAKSSAVFTTRMHAGILAAMLKRQTVLFEGPYHKIRGVYEFSLAHRGIVRLEPAPGTPA